jgi:hypothetical protein
MFKDLQELVMIAVLAVALIPVCYSAVREKQSRRRRKCLIRELNIVTIL